MHRFRNIFMPLSLAGILLLVVLCVVSAFLGADRAGAMFNSTPLVVFWGVLALLLAVGLGRRKVLRSPGLAAMHLGGLLVIAGGAWGSDLAHDVRAGWLEREKFPDGQMNLFTHLAPHMIYSRVSVAAGPGQHVGQLPFNLRLNNAWVEYHPSGGSQWELCGVVHDPPGRPPIHQEMDGQIGRVNHFAAAGVDVKVLCYDTDIPAVKLELSHGRDRVIGWVTAGPNAEFERLSLESVFADESFWLRAGGPVILLMPPPRIISDYKADLTVVDTAGRELKQKIIEVNDPLHFGGYHVYLARFDEHSGVLGLHLKSDEGLYWVYAGFGLVWLGLIIRLWLGPAWRALRRHRAETTEEAVR